MVFKRRVGSTSYSRPALGRSKRKTQEVMSSRMPTTDIYAASDCLTALSEQDAQDLAADWGVRDFSAGSATPSPDRWHPGLANLTLAPPV